MTREAKICKKWKVDPDYTVKDLRTIGSLIEFISKNIPHVEFFKEKAEKNGCNDLSGPISKIKDSGYMDIIREKTALVNAFIEILGKDFIKAGAKSYIDFLQMVITVVSCY